MELWILALSAYESGLRYCCLCMVRYLVGLVFLLLFVFFFFNDTATTEIYTLSLHDALPISIQAQLPKLPQLMRRTARSTITTPTKTKLLKVS